MTGESNRTLYVGNLDPSVTEDLIRALFTQLGEVLSCKMFQEANTDPYCFVEFGDHCMALHAITMMNDKLLQTRRMRVDWATGQGNKNKANKIDTTKHFHVYVGELSPEIDEQALREAFQVFGEISDCKVVKDPQTFKSRGYGFVVFVKRYDAEVSIQNMNGQWLGRKMIKARWATRKLQSITQESKPEQTSLDYDEVFNQTTGTNTTVFCGGLKQDITEETLQQAFHSYGPIDKIKIFKEKGYAFIKYTCKEHACQAIVVQHNSSLNGQTIRCSWGKDTGPEGVPQPPSATSPTLLDHPGVVSTPIPAAAVVTGQPVTMTSAAVAAAYANAAAAAGVPLGMQHMAAAVTGQPLMGSPHVAAQYAAAAAASPAQMTPIAAAAAAGQAHMHPHAVTAAAPVSSPAAPASAHQPVLSYYQYYPQHVSAAAAAAAAAQQQQQQQQQQHAHSKQFFRLIVRFKDGSDGDTRRHCRTGRCSGRSR
uniref:Nucleolysin TIAR-like n=1 Tax=Hirondellea gigas TaxID=1518452 RepID=A0A2P2IBI9_9CRUS